MADTSVVTTRIKGELVEQLDQLATAYERTRGWHIAKAIERYVAEEVQLLDMIREGEEDFAAGRYITHEDLVAEIKAMREHRDAA